MENNTKTLTDDEFNRITEHFTLLYNNHRYLAYSFRKVSNDDVLIFILTYIGYNADLIRDIVDDSRKISNILSENKILIPIM